VRKIRCGRLDVFFVEGAQHSSRKEENQNQENNIDKRNEIFLSLFFISSFETYNQLSSLCTI
jgi:hypothetical protein